MRDALRSLAINPSPGVTVNRGTGGTTLRVKPSAEIARGGGVASVNEKCAFRIVNTSTDETPQIQVQTGYVRQTMSAESSMSITGLLTDLEVESDSIIFLKWDGSSYSVFCQSASDLTDWTVYPELIEIQPEEDVAEGEVAVQLAYYVVIGYVGAVPDTPEDVRGFSVTIDVDSVPTDFFVYQALETNLAESDICHNGTPSVYAYPSGAPIV